MGPVKLCVETDTDSSETADPVEIKNIIEIVDSLYLFILILPSVSAFSISSDVQTLFTHEAQVEIGFKKFLIFNQLKSFLFDFFDDGFFISTCVRHYPTRAIPFYFPEVYDD